MLRPERDRGSPYFWLRQNLLCPREKGKEIQSFPGKSSLSVPYLKWGATAQGFWVLLGTEGYFSFGICKGKEKVGLMHTFTQSTHPHVTCPFLLAQPFHSPNLSATANNLHPPHCSPVPSPTYSSIPLSSRQDFTCRICLKNSINTCHSKCIHSKIKIIRYNTLTEADSVCGHPLSCSLFCISSQSCIWIQTDQTR